MRITRWLYPKYHVLHIDKGYFCQDGKWSWDREKAMLFSKKEAGDMNLTFLNLGDIGIVVLRAGIH